MNLVNDMIMALPPLQGDRDVIIPGEQSVKDIIREVCAAHREFASDYDCISDFFVGKNVLRTLFDFCQANLPYVMESEKMQTTRSPTAILSLADYWGCDCKHYAGFIAGVIDACNRAGYTNYEWCYRFASYDPFSSQKEHVYIVVKNDGREIWIDPAPIENMDGTFTTRSFNDRKVIPCYQSDNTPKTFQMSLQRIRGCCPGNAYIGYLSRDAYSLQENDLYQYSQNYGRVQLPDEGALIYEPISIQPQQTDVVFYDPGYVDPMVQADPVSEPFPAVTYDQYPIEPDFNPADYGKIETVTRPEILDYPQVTGEPIATLPSTFNLANPADAGQISDTSLKVNFSVMDFVKANPVETALIGAAVIGIGYLVFRKKKKKRA